MFLFYTAAMTHMNMEMQTKHNSCTSDRSCDLLLDDSCSGSITAESLRYSSWIVFSAVILTTFFMGGKCSMLMTKILCDVWNWSLIVTAAFDSLSFHLRMIKHCNKLFKMTNLTSWNSSLLRIISTTEGFVQPGAFPREQRPSHPTPETEQNWS